MKNKTNTKPQDETSCYPNVIWLEILLDKKLNQAEFLAEIGFARFSRI